MSPRIQASLFPPDFFSRGDLAFVSLANLMNTSTKIRLRPRSPHLHLPPILWHHVSL
jgi:hypothetical protein